MDAFMTKLAHSRILTPRFQALHLLINYSLLALACAVYLIFDTPAWIIPVGATPGAVVFIVSLEALAYRKAIEGGDLLEVFQGLGR